MVLNGVPASTTLISEEYTSEIAVGMWVAHNPCMDNSDRRYWVSVGLCDD